MSDDEPPTDRMNIQSVSIKTTSQRTETRLQGKDSVNETTFSLFFLYPEDSKHSRHSNLHPTDSEWSMQTELKKRATESVYVIPTGGKWKIKHKLNRSQCHLAAYWCYTVHIPKEKKHFHLQTNFFSFLSEVCLCESLKWNPLFSLNCT